MRAVLILVFFLISRVSMAYNAMLPSIVDAVKDVDTVQVYQPKHPRITAAVLTFTLGMLGAHRLYLGAKPWVPIFYVVSVGGVFFILPLLDLIAILSHKDITPYYNNNKILMWLK